MAVGSLLEIPGGEGGGDIVGGGGRLPPVPEQGYHMHFVAGRSCFIWSIQYCNGCSCAIVGASDERSKSYFFLKDNIIRSC
jgi:hypothetical protein